MLSPGKSMPVAPAEPVGVHPLEQALLAHQHADLDGADVARLLEDLAHACR